MADEIAKAECRCGQCGVIFFQPVRRYLLKHCSKECRETSRAEKRKAAARTRRKICPQCSAEYDWTYGKGNGFHGFCSAKCHSRRNRDEARDRRAKGYSPPSRPRPRRPKPCEQCGKTTTRPRFCSPSCSVKARDIRLGVFQREERACAECGAIFMADHPRRRFCSCQCERSVRNRKSSAIRRARVRDAERERFDPVEVLERDRWRCHICGVTTPKRLRGTFDDRAPELDHIVPLAAGGEHSRRNTACACRKCNLAKGDHPLGQLRLVA